MAHQIDQSVNAQGAFISYKTPAWHGLGITTEEELTMPVILAHKGIDFKVDLDEVRTVRNGIIVPDQFATYRTDTGAPLAIVGDRYRVLQHTREFQLFDEVLSEAGYTYETAGVLRGGREVFLLAKRPAELVASEDTVQPYIGMFFSYDSKSSTRIKNIATRVVCANTHRVALDEDGMLLDHAVKHTASQESRMEDIREQLARSAAAFTHYVETARSMVERPVTSGLMEQAVMAALQAALGKQPSDTKEAESWAKRATKAAGQITDAMASPEQAVGGIYGSVWSAYNGISQWADHVLALGVKGNDRAKAERRFMSAVAGKADEVKQAAWSALLAA